MDNYQALHQFIEQFISLTGEEFAQLKKRSSVVHVRKKDVITSAGETENYLYYVARGLVREYFFKAGEAVTSQVIAEGTVFGSVSSFLTGTPSHFCLEAMEPCSLVTIQKGQLEELYRSSPRWEKFGRILTTHFVLRQEREVMLRYRLAPRERFIRFVEENPQLLQRVPQKYLASLLQIKPETFSRMKHLLYRSPRKMNGA